MILSRDLRRCKLKFLNGPRSFRPRDLAAAEGSQTVINSRHSAEKIQFGGSVFYGSTPEALRARTLSLG